jgi:hypothetical protein
MARATFERVGRIGVGVIHRRGRLVGGSRLSLSPGRALRGPVGSTRAGALQGRTKLLFPILRLQWIPIHRIQPIGYQPMS